MVFDSKNEIKDISYYNNLYFKLESEFEGCSIVLVRCFDDSNGVDIDFGNIVNDKFEAKLYGYGEAKYDSTSGNDLFFLTNDSIQTTPWY